MLDKISELHKVKFDNLVPDVIQNVGGVWNETSMQNECRTKYSCSEIQLPCFPTNSFITKSRLMLYLSVRPIFQTDSDQHFSLVSHQFCME